MSDEEKEAKKVKDLSMEIGSFITGKFGESPTTNGEAFTVLTIVTCALLQSIATSERCPLNLLFEDFIESLTMYKESQQPASNQKPS